MQYFKPLHEVLAQALQDTCLTDREVADHLGYSNQRIIRLYAEGKARVRITVAPQLAEFVGLDAKRFLRTALAEYDPELLTILDRYFVPDPLRAGSKTLALPKPESGHNE